MFKLVKYEYRKDITMYTIIFAGLFVLEAYLLGSILAESEANIAISILLYTLAGFAGVIMLMVLGVISYSREINSKSSFMTFMTPNSTYKIVGAKYFAIFSASVLATALYMIFIVIDVKVALNVYNELGTVSEFLDEILFTLDTSISELTAVLVSMFISVWMSIILVVSFAYLAITLSATLLANKKGKGWLSFGLFVAIYVITTIITNHLPTFDFGDSLMQLIAGSWISYVFELALIIGTYFGVSILLKKKVSL